MKNHEGDPSGRKIKLSTRRVATLNATNILTVIAFLIVHLIVIHAQQTSSSKTWFLLPRHLTENVNSLSSTQVNTNPNTITPIQSSSSLSSSSLTDLIPTLSSSFYKTIRTIPPHAQPNPNETQDSPNDTPHIQDLFQSTYNNSLYLNFTYYFDEESDFVDRVCTFDLPCSDLHDIMFAVNSTLYSESYYYNFTIVPNIERFVIVNIVLKSNAVLIYLGLTVPSFPNLKYLFHWTSQEGEIRKNVDWLSFLDPPSRTDIVWICFSNLHLTGYDNSITLTTYNVGVYNCQFEKIFLLPFFGSTLIYEKTSLTQVDTRRIEYCETVIFYNVDLKEECKIRFQQVNTFIFNNVKAIESSVATIQIDFSRKTFIRNSVFKNYSSKFALTSNVEVTFENCVFDHVVTSTFAHYGAIVTAFLENTLSIRNCTFSRGYSAVYVREYTKLELITSQFFNNTVTIIIESNDMFTLNSVVNLIGCAILTIIDCKFDHNVGAQKGSALYIKDSMDAVIHWTSFMNGNGSAIYVENIKTTSQENFSIRILKSRFENNYSDDYGGAIRLLTSIKHFSIDLSKFIGNQARYSGGAVFIELVQQVSWIAGSLFQDNRVLYSGSHDHEQFYKGRGGAVFLLFSTPTPLAIADSFFVHNQANIGGALSYAYTSVKNIFNCTFEKNVAQKTGGAIFHFSPSPKTSTNFSMVQFENNQAGVYGNDYFSSVTSVRFDQIEVELYPGKC